jgi:orotidine-5'-phosphate decarboxylase
MKRQELVNLIRSKKSFLCVGLDSDINKIPKHLLTKEDPVFEFNKAIIDATLPYTVAYKPNLAFYESRGIEGLVSLKKTMDYLHQFKDECFTIADAKRGDIGNTAAMYADSFFNEMQVDSVTVAPYMGKDSVTPFLGYDGKWVILLALTSNPGAEDFQYTIDTDGTPLYQKVLKRSLEWANADNMMYVVGATRAAMLADIRKIVPDSFLLVPGVGAQGGSLEEVCKYGMNSQCGLIVNSSRAIIYADKSENFAKVAGEKAQEVQQQMAAFL